MATPARAEAAAMRPVCFRNSRRDPVGFSGFIEGFSGKEGGGEGNRGLASIASTWFPLPPGEGWGEDGCERLAPEGPLIIAQRFIAGSGGQ